VQKYLAMFTMSMTVSLVCKLAQSPSDLATLTLSSVVLQSELEVLKETAKELSDATSAEVDQWRTDGR
jgi:hypothetical protein